MLCCWVIFFFKQKTAYEVRISDWSSDVCSSDLPSFEVNSALLSRARVYVLESLSSAELQGLLRRAMAVFNADVEQARGDDPSAGGDDGAETIDSADAVDSADASDAGLRFDPDAQAQLAA